MSSSNSNIRSSPSASRTDNSSVAPKPHSRKLKILTTISILYGNITLGCSAYFYGPALEEFRVKFNTTIEDLSQIFTIILVTYCIGTVFSPILYKFVNRQLVVLACFGVFTAVLLVITHTTSKTVFFIILATLGIFEGLYNAAQIVWMIEIWQEKAGPLIQAQHFFFALGTNISPLLLGPFLNKGTKDQNEETKPHDSQLYIPFTIGGAISAGVFFYQLFLFTCYRYYKPPMYSQTNVPPGDVDMENHSKPEDNNAAAEDQKQWSICGHSVYPKKIQLLIMVGLFLGAFVGMEITTMQFIPTFAQRSALHLSESYSSYLLSGATGAYAVARFLGIFIALKLPPLPMIVVNLVIILAANVVLLCWGGSHVGLLWTSCILFGTGFSTIMGAFSAFMEKHIVFTNGVGAYMLLAGGLVGAPYPLIVGKRIEHHPEVLTYPNFASILICSVVLLWGFMLTRNDKRRY